MQHCKTWLRSLQPHVLSNVHIETDTRDLRRALKKKDGRGEGGRQGINYIFVPFHKTTKPYTQFQLIQA